jgi:hypothetical protein
MPQSLSAREAPQPECIANHRPELNAIAVRATIGLRSNQTTAASHSMPLARCSSRT